MSACQPFFATARVVAHCFRPHAPRRDASQRASRRALNIVQSRCDSLHYKDVRLTTYVLCRPAELPFVWTVRGSQTKSVVWTKGGERASTHMASPVRRTEVLHKRAEDAPTSLKSAQPSRAIRASTSLADGMLSMAPSTSTAIAEATEARCMMALIRSDVSESDSCKLMSPATK